jgi:hypothetical protein
MTRRAERARILRECAVDLIRASDLADGDDFAAVDSAARRIRHVIAELENVAPQIRSRAEWLERLRNVRTNELAA